MAKKRRFWAARRLGSGKNHDITGSSSLFRFCTTGGISRINAADFLALPNVACVGASWVATPAELEAKDWAAIEANARFAAGL